MLNIPTAIEGSNTTMDLLDSYYYIAESDRKGQHFLETVADDKELLPLLMYFKD
jgi:hypothetical protein